MNLSLTFEGKTVRMVGTPERPEWVARDVCEALGIGKYRDALARIPSDEKGCPVRVDTPGGPQDVATVAEAGLFRLILRSDRPDAKRFQSWVVGDVLPTLRKYGQYPVPRSGDRAPSHVELFVQAARALEEVSGRIDAVESRVGQIEAVQAEARAAGPLLPPAPAEVANASHGALTEARIKAYAMANSLPFGVVFHRFFDASYLRLRVALQPARRGKKKLREAIDGYQGELPAQIYSLACEMFPVSEAA